jgi:hypothetical protein
MDADFVGKEELEELLNERGDTCVSIYLPMERRGPDVRGNHVQLKNALSEVEDELKEQGWNHGDIDEFLEDARDYVGDEPFWQHQVDGLALFLSPTFFRIYRVPLSFEPLTQIGRRFHVKPLLPLFSDDGRFYILALSQDRVRLFQGTRHAVDEMELEDTPGSMADALAYDDPEEQLQHHTTGSGAGQEPAAVHHGHGVSDDEEKQRLRRFFHQVSDGIEKQLADDEAPLVLAAVDYLHPIYKEVASSPHLLDEGVTGNPDELSAEELHEKAWDIVEPLFQEAKDEVIERYNELEGSEQASDQLEEIVSAAYQGRVDALFVAVDVEKWGSYRLEDGQIELHDEPQNGDEDLLDFAAAQTLAYGGTVYAVNAAEVPGRTPLAAVYRF